jgi:hypothetical protein
MLGNLWFDISIFTKKKLERLSQLAPIWSPRCWVLLCWVSLNPLKHFIDIRTRITTAIYQDDHLDIHFIIKIVNLPLSINCCVISSSRIVGRINVLWSKVWGFESSFQWICRHSPHYSAKFDLSEICLKWRWQWLATLKICNF